MKTSAPSGPRSQAQSPTPTTGTWTEPRTGDIIRYIYLWRRQHERGDEDGEKIRPCLVVATYRKAGRLQVIITPLTTRDYDPAHSILLPRRFSEDHGLDPRSSVVWNEANRFAWTGPDVRAGRDGAYLIAVMPEAIVRQVARGLENNHHRITPRSE